MMKRTLLTAAALAIVSISGARAADSQQGSVHSITLPQAPPPVPDGPGKDAYMANCILCHTPRYVMIQPAFTRQKWTDEVNKMRKTYGAPIAEEKVDDIVNYLVSVRGKAGGATPAK
jgi:sulfite dehydrogenase (cytochrome) subunit B